MANEIRLRAAGVAGTLSGAFAVGATPSFRAAATGGSSGTSVAVTIPASAVAGDLLVATVTYNGQITPPTGWTAHPTSAVNGTLYMTVFYRTCQAGDAGASVTWSGAAAGGVNAWMGSYPNGGTPIVKGATAGASATTYTTPAPNVAANSVGLQVAAQKSSVGASNITVSGGTNRGGISGGDSGSGAETIVAVEDPAPDSTARTFTSIGAAVWVGMGIEIPSPTGTTMSSTGLADLPVIDTTNHAAITLIRRDTAGRITQKEIVHVTSHAAGATTASVVVGQEGTSSQVWAAGDTWVHGPTPRDFGPSRVVAVTSAYTMQPDDAVVLANGTFTVTLPADVANGAGVYVGRRYTVKNTGTGTITITPPSGTVDGGATVTLTVQYSSYDFVTDGTNWFTV